MIASITAIVVFVLVDLVAGVSAAWAIVVAIAALLTAGAPPDAWASRKATSLGTAYVVEQHLYCRVGDEVIDRLTSLLGVPHRVVDGV